MVGMGRTFGHYGCTIVLGHDLPPMLVRGGGPIARLSAGDPPLNGAAMDAKAPRQFRLRDPLGSQFTHQDPLGHGQHGVGMILHRYHVPICTHPLNGCANLLYHYT